jgi:hypothetical protein
VTAETPPRLVVICSSKTGQARLERAADALLGRMPPEMAARLARQVLVFALDAELHAGFCQQLSDPTSATGRLAAERVRQHAGPEDPLYLIVVRLDYPRPDLERLLGHELGHVFLGHPAAAAREQLDDAALAEQEQEANAFAARFAAGF